MSILGTVIGGAFGLLGAKKKSDSTLEANAQNIKFQREANFQNRKHAWGIKRFDAQQVRGINRQNRRQQDKINRANMKAQDKINRRNIRSADKANKLNVRLQDKVNKRNIALARETNEQQQANFETQRQDAKSAIQTTVADAQAAGINPLTAIRGGQSYQGPGAPALMSATTEAAMIRSQQVEAAQQEAAIAYAPPGGGAAHSVAPQVMADTSMGDAISDLGATMFSSFANQPDPEREALEMALMRQELKDRQERATPIWRDDFGYSIPHVVNYTGIDHGAASESDPLGDGGGLPERVDSGDNLRLLGAPLQHSPLMSNAEDYETRYGDWGGSVLGFGVLGVDAAKTAWHYGRKAASWASAGMDSYFSEPRFKRFKVEEPADANPTMPWVQFYSD